MRFRFDCTKSDFGSKVYDYETNFYYFDVSYRFKDVELFYLWCNNYNLINGVLIIFSALFTFYFLSVDSYIANIDYLLLLWILSFVNLSEILYLFCYYYFSGLKLFIFSYSFFDICLPLWYLPPLIWAFIFLSPSYF